MNWPYYIKVRKTDVKKAQKVLEDFKTKRDIDDYRFERWNEDFDLCCFTPIVSSDIPEIINTLIKNGIQII
jgi:hypothetical protein